MANNFTLYEKFRPNVNPHAETKNVRLFNLPSITNKLSSVDVVSFLKKTGQTQNPFLFMKDVYFANYCGIIYNSIILFNKINKYSTLQLVSFMTIQ